MRYESEMIAPIRDRLAGHWKDGLLFEEFGVGYGVADVVAVGRDGADIVFHPRTTTPRSEELFLMTKERIWEQIHASA